MNAKSFFIAGKIFSVLGLLNLLSMLVAAWGDGSFLGLTWEQLGWSALLFILLGFGDLYTAQIVSKKE